MKNIENEFYAILRIPHDDLEEINGYLEADYDYDEDEELQDEDRFQGEDETISHSVRFPDGMVMDVDCCGSDDDASWTQAVLFTKSEAGYLEEVSCTEPDYSYTGEWEFDYKGRAYRVKVVDGGDIDKVQLEPVLAPDGMTTGWAVDDKEI